MRVFGEAAFILHHRDWSETSLTLDVFTGSHGRIALVAKGARRPSSPWRGLLKPFQPLLLGWSGRGDMPILIQAEADGESLVTQGPTLYCGFYLNELLLRLLHRHDPHERLFRLYREALTALVSGASAEVTLRVFERHLLDELGYGLVLDRDVADGSVIDPATLYDYHVESGPIRAVSGGTGSRIEGVAIHGRSLLALAREQLDDPEALREVKRLMRVALDRHLGGRPLRTRELFRRVAVPPPKVLKQETGT